MTTAAPSFKVRELHHAPLGRHWVLVTGGMAVADVYGKGQEFTTIVRAHSAPRLTGPRVATSPSLDTAVARFTEAWAA